MYVLMILKLRHNYIIIICKTGRASWDCICCLTCGTLLWELWPQFSLESLSAS